MILLLDKVPGKVITAPVSRVKEILPQCEEIWLITRAGKDIPGTIRVRGLSPGPELYKKYVEEWKETDPREWWPAYVSKFMEELGLPEKRAALRKLWRLLQMGKNVGLVCFCPDPGFCHRTIIGDVLREKGVHVEEAAQPAARKDACFVQEAFNFG